MTQSDRGAAGSSIDPDDVPPDPGELLFELDSEPAGRGPDRARRSAQRRRAWLAALVVAALAVAVVGFLVVRLKNVGVQDYSGDGYGSVRISVAPGQTASDIADTLASAGVVKSSEAFVDAAKTDPRSTGIQPGQYVLHKHMSGHAALLLLLDPRSRDTGSDTVVPEGSTVLTVQDALRKFYGDDATDRIRAVFDHPQRLTLPRGYSPAGGGQLTSLEGFLYPATYTFDPGSAPADAVQQMVTQFTAADRQIGFASQAQALHLTPYQALIIASIAQSEAKFPQDMPKVVRTILNRLRLGRPLQSDAPSAYACKLHAIDPCVYSKVDSPYNTYRHSGLPPTPIDDPGMAALKAAVRPASGNWLYFVNKDAAGHLFFTNSEQAFAKAAQKCAAEHWGCAG